MASVCVCLGFDINGIHISTPTPWPLIQTLVIWPAVVWLRERQAALHFHSLPHSLTFPQPHSNPTVTHIDSKPCYSPLLAVTLHTIKVLVMMFNNKQQSPHLAQRGLEPTENLHYTHEHIRDFGHCVFEPIITHVNLCWWEPRT